MGKVCATDGCENDVVYDRENKCKTCVSKQRRTRYITDRKYYLNNRYNAMKQRAEGRSNYPTGATGLPMCTREEFLEWFENTKDEFYRLWAPYETSDFLIDLAPSVDRKDSKKGYVIGNLQWLTHSDNAIKRDN